MGNSTEMGGMIVFEKKSLGCDKGKQCMNKQKGNCKLQEKQNSMKTSWSK